MNRFESVEALLAAPASLDLGYTEWHRITQEMVDQFAEVTGDHQWIHVDPKRASLGPFGGTVAHGYLTLALLATWLDEILQIEGVRMGLNYGLNRVRFPAPVPVGSRLRARGTVVSTRRRGEYVEVTIELVGEIDQGGKPCCIAEMLAWFAG